MTQPGPAGRLTLAHIAQRAGTTVPTVSKVLNGRSDVGAITREKVMAIVAETGYRRSPRRNTLRGRPTGTLPAAGLVDLVLNTIEGSWANLALAGVEQAATEAGLDVVVTLSRDPADEINGWLPRLLNRGSGGAVLALVQPAPSQLATLDAAGVPVVLLDPSAEPDSGVASVGASNYSGGRAAGEHLLNLGHVGLAVIGGRRDQLFSQARIDGFTSAAAGAGLRIPASRIRHTHLSRSGARQEAARLLRLTDPPTAIFAATDDMALGVYQAASDLGLRIPDQLSVVGFDDLPEAQWVTPGLTTVRQPVQEMAAAALRLLLRLRAGASVNKRLEFATELISRGSCSPHLGI